MSRPPKEIRYVVDENGCWIWALSKDRFGYGNTKVNKVTYRAHRWYWMQANGPIPDGMTIDHLCFQPSCVNPEHLRLMEPRANFANQRKAFATACSKGHEYTAENTYRKPTGGRDCRKCGCERSRKYAAKKKAEVSA